MGTFYRVSNTGLEDFLVALGLVHHSREENENVMYFTNHANGMQVKLHKRGNLISILDNKGVEIDSSSSYTDNQLVKFLD